MPLRLRLAPVLLGLAILLMSVARAASADAVLDRARGLIDAGRGAEAYAILAPLENQRAGEEAYDYLLGVSALAARHPGLAAFALERVLAVDPGNVKARAQLARAYFDLHDNRLARQQFEQVRATSPPDTVRRTIDRYLSALDARFESLRPTQWRGYVQAGLGYDTNANSATSSSTVAVPALGNLTFRLAPAGVEQKSLFLEGEAGASVSHRIQPGLYAFANARINGKNNTALRADQFDTSEVDLSAGMSLSRGRDLYSGAIQSQWFNVDNALYRSLVGLNLQWQRSLDARTQVSVFGHGASVTFHPAAQRLRDVFQVLGGVGFAHSFDREGQPVVFGSAYFAEDIPTHSGAVHLGRTFGGLRAGGQYTLRSDLDLYGSASLEVSGYGGTEPLFLVSRKDTYSSFTVGLNYRPQKQWVIRPEVRYVVNSSNVPISDYSRTLASVKIRYDFR